MRAIPEAADATPPRVARIRPEDWQLYWDLRIEFVESSPDAILGNPAFMRSRSAKMCMDLASELSWHSDIAAFVAWLGAEAVGFVGVQLLRHADVSTITHLWVRPTSRRQGIGESLLRAALEFVQASGVAKASLWASMNNPDAIHFYGRHGFTKTCNQRALRGDARLTQVELERTL